jgi:hypothetical protein
LAKKFETGDVHAPVEDVEVPFGLKILVVMLCALLLGLAIGLALTADQLGVLSLPS